MCATRPPTLGIDENVAVTSLAVDGDDASGFLIDWIGGLRIAPMLPSVILGWITIAGLGVVDIARLSKALVRATLHKASIPEPSNPRAEQPPTRAPSPGTAGSRSRRCMNDGKYWF